MKISPPHCSWFLPVSRGVLLVFLLASAGCKIELYSQLSQQEANEMLALLLEQGIPSKKQPEKDNLVSLYVEERQIPEAIELLRSHGYPKDTFSTIQDLLATDKLISTPFEDRTRYIYGLSQGIAETLSHVDGVVSVRVHVVMPDESRDQQTHEASAAVFIKHNPDYDFNSYIPEFKSIVANGIEGLAYDAVNVALFPARKEQGQEDVVKLSSQQLTSILSIDLTQQSAQRFYLLLGGCLGVILLLLALNLYLFVRQK